MYVYMDVIVRLKNKYLRKILKFFMQLSNNLMIKNKIIIVGTFALISTVVIVLAYFFNSRNMETKKKLVMNLKTDLGKKVGI